jgi:acetylglutamate kinase
MDLQNIIPKDGPAIEEVQKYIKKYIDEIIVIKCGGSVLLNQNLFNQFIQDISVINKLGLNSVIIHGGGRNIKKKLDQQNIESKFIDGLRVTDKIILKVVDEALTELNLEIVKKLNIQKCKAQSITTKKNNVITTFPERKELGFVGNPKEVKKETLLTIINNKEVPVIVPMGIGDDHNPYNINADIAAGAIAKTLNSRRLLLMTDVEGVLDKNKKLISEINSKIAQEMIKAGTIIGGMIPKINTCIDAVNNGVTGVVIVDGRKPHSILFELFSDKGAGTLIRK